MLIHVSIEAAWMIFVSNSCILRGCDVALCLVWRAVCAAGMLTVTAASGTMAGCFLFSVGTMNEIWWDDAREKMRRLNIHVL